MSKKKKRHLWLGLAVLRLTGAALFSRLPRRAAAGVFVSYCEKTAL